MTWYLKMMVNSITIALTGLNNASARLNASASNIANATTNTTPSSEVSVSYRPKTIQSTALDNGGVQSQIIDKPLIAGTPQQVDYAEEIVHIKLAELSYKANIATIKTSTEMFETLLSTFDKEV